MFTYHVILSDFQTLYICRKLEPLNFECPTGAGIILQSHSVRVQVTFYYILVLAHDVATGDTKFLEFVY